ncbi:RNA polymerase sigma-70 factor, ECF subfamily [Tenacibaculum sp. MAR_2009_124]|uniref:RNA polymerase sigma factor n=1 Tax=Tenacibaculum sp. MAR_2009_124 TaxID=1250059 RepID=UPI00089B7D92|nr:RNA polymerase sigma factor [Tenacibaculum sp. MAR_2009_124]SEB37934.1 RNA polymerase sigma-70 factor, ECF subfamily [Tenacibaculum sp. MAR_2009_124]
MKKRNKKEDSYLVKACLLGDEKATVKLVKKWHLVFCKVAYTYTKDRDVAKDIAQESWSKILTKLDSIKDSEKFESWALSIVKSKTIDYLRSDKRKKELLTKYYIENSNIKRETENVGENYRQILKKEIESLSEGQKAVIKLYYIQEYSLKEISAILKISVGTAKSRMFHARERLKKIILNSKL